MHEVRLFVGGLAADVTAEQLAQRFQAFGAVRGSQVQAPRHVDAAGAACRGFGYVQLDLADEAALRRVINAYNGSKWRGQALKVQLARPDYLTRLREEWAWDEAAARAAQAPLEARAPSSDALVIAGPHDTEVTVAPNKRKTAFPAHKPVPLSQLSWEDLPPTAALLRKRAFVETVTPAYNAAKAVRQQAARKRAKVAAEEPAASEELAAVDFMDGEITAQAPVDLSRFSDSEDEQHPSFTGTLAAGAAATLAAAEEPGEADALWEQQGGIDQYLAALAAEQSAGEEGSESQPAASLAASEPAASSDSAADTPALLREDQAAAASSLSEGSAGGDSAPSSSAQQGLADSVAGGSPPDHGQQTADKESSGCSGGSGDGSASPDRGEAAEAAQPDAESLGQSADGDAGSVDEGAAASDEDDGSQSSSQQAPEVEQDWAAVFPELEAGCQFWAGGAGAQAREVRWRSTRRELAAEWKSARREALRRASTAHRGRHPRR